MVLLTAACSGGSGGQPDNDFDVSVPQRLFTSNAPRVVIDHAHHNIHRANGTYRPFAHLLENAGFDVRSSNHAFDAGTLARADILVIANAIGTDDQNREPAYSEQEVAAVQQWVQNGGALLLITDHFPVGDANRALAQAFGVDMGGGAAEDSLHYDRRFDPTHIVFARADGGLAEHAITRGLDSVLSFTGQSLDCSKCQKILVLSEHASDRAAKPNVIRRGGDVIVEVAYGEPTAARGRAQLLALTFGRGRVVVTGEAAMLTAQLSRYDGSAFGMNVPPYDNKQLVLNTVFWLSGAGSGLD